MQTTSKKYWLRFGIIFFVIFFVLFSYAAFTINNNEPAVRTMMVAEEQPFAITDLLPYIPGMSVLVGFALAGAGGLLVGSFILSLIYGAIGSLIGVAYSKIKKQQ